MKKFIFNLILENKNTNYTSCKTYTGIGSTLDTCRRDIREQLENEVNDLTYYTRKLTEEFIKVNKLNPLQIRTMKLLVRNLNNLDDDYSLSEFELDYFDIGNFWSELKMVFSHLKELSEKTLFNLAVEELAPGYYHSLNIKKEYLNF